jgi:hypothetical protein
MDSLVQDGNEKNRQDARKGRSWERGDHAPDRQGFGNTLSRKIVFADANKNPVQTLFSEKI